MYRHTRQKPTRASQDNVVELQLKGRRPKVERPRRIPQPLRVSLRAWELALVGYGKGFYARAHGRTGVRAKYADTCARARICARARMVCSHVRTCAQTRKY